MCTICHCGLCRGEYIEAQRLRNLSNAVQTTFYEQCAGSNDNDNIMNRIQFISRGKESYFDLEELIVIAIAILTKRCTVDNVM